MLDRLLRDRPWQVETDYHTCSVARRTAREKPYHSATYQSSQYLLPGFFSGRGANIEHPLRDVMIFTPMNAAETKPDAPKPAFIKPASKPASATRRKALAVH